MNDDKNKRDERVEAYPRPTETDKQLKNQPEFVDQEPNKFKKEISDVPEDDEREEDE